MSNLQDKAPKPTLDRAEAHQAKELSPELQRALDAMAERSRHPQTANTVIRSASGFVLVKPQP